MNISDTRKALLGQIERQLREHLSPEGDMFLYHPSEDRVVLSHALSRVMPTPCAVKHPGQTSKSALPEK